MCVHSWNNGENPEGTKVNEIVKTLTATITRQRKNVAVSASRLSRLHHLTLIVCMCVCVCVGGSRITPNGKCTDKADHPKTGFMLFISFPPPLWEVSPTSNLNFWTFPLPDNCMRHWLKLLLLQRRAKEEAATVAHEKYETLDLTHVTYRWLINVGLRSRCF